MRPAFGAAWASAALVLASCATAPVFRHDDKVEFTEASTLPGSGYSVVATRSKGEIWTVSGSSYSVLFHGGRPVRFKARLSAAASRSLTDALSDPALYESRQRRGGCTDAFSRVQIHFEGRDAEIRPPCLGGEPVAPLARLLELLRGG